MSELEWCVVNEQEEIGKVDESLPLPRRGHLSWYWADRFYIAGGYYFNDDPDADDMQHIIRDDIWEWSFSEEHPGGTWNKVTRCKLPLPLDGASCHLVGHHLYVVCGHFPSQFEFVCSNSVFILNLLTWEWDFNEDANDAANVSPRVWHASALISAPLPEHLVVGANNAEILSTNSAAIIVFGGRNEHLEYFNDLWLYHIDGRVWLPIMSELAPSPRAAHALTTMVCHDQIYLVTFGGRFKLSSRGSYAQEKWWLEGEDDDPHVGRTPPIPQSHTHYRDVCVLNLSVAPLQWTHFLAAQKPEGQRWPSARCCLSACPLANNNNNRNMSILYLGGYRCSNMFYRYFKDLWQLNIIPVGEELRVDWQLKSLPAVQIPLLSVNNVASDGLGNWFVFGGEGKVAQGARSTNYLQDFFILRTRPPPCSDLSPFQHHISRLLDLDAQAPRGVHPLVAAVRCGAFPLNIEFKHFSTLPLFRQWLYVGDLEPRSQFGTSSLPLPYPLIALLELIKLSFYHDKVSWRYLRMHAIEAARPYWLACHFSATPAPDSLVKEWREFAGEVIAESTLHGDTELLQFLSNPTPPWNWPDLYSQSPGCSVSGQLESDFEALWQLVETDSSQSAQAALQPDFSINFTTHASTTTWRVHKAILRVRSPFFESLLNSGMREVTEACYQMSALSPDLSVQQQVFIVKSLLRYFYTNSLPQVGPESDSPAVWTELFNLAHYWGLGSDLTAEEHTPLFSLIENALS